MERKHDLWSQLPSQRAPWLVLQLGRDPCPSLVPPVSFVYCCVMENVGALGSGLSTHFALGSRLLQMLFLLPIQSGLSLVRPRAAFCRSSCGTWSRTAFPELLSCHRNSVQLSSFLCHLVSGGAAVFISCLSEAQTPWLN